jgi:hypothetical protein
MCLLLTLLAVPVFYSLFDDAAESTVFKSISGGISKVTSPIKDAVSGIFGTKKSAGNVREEHID